MCIRDSIHIIRKYKLFIVNLFVYSGVYTAHPPASTTETQQQQQQTRVMHQIATQSKDPITKAVATNIVGAHKTAQPGGEIKNKFKCRKYAHIFGLENYLFSYIMNLSVYEYFREPGWRKTIL